MSTRTPNINLEKPSSDENYSIAVFNGNSDTIDTEMALRVKTADIVNNLTTTVTNKPLSAAQGKALNDAKVNVSDIQNNLTSTATNKPLSAAQGKALSDTIATVSNTVTNFRNASGGSANAGSDANKITSNGIYYRWYQSGSNFPDNSGGYLYVARHQSNTNYCSQIFIREDGVILNRTNTNGTWSAWRRMYDESSLFVEKLTFSESKTIASGGSTSFNVSVAKSGCTPIGIVGIIGSGTSSLALQEYSIQGNNAIIYYGNITSSQKTVSNLSLNILYKRN